MIAALTEDNQLGPSKRPVDLPELACVKVDVQDDADINFLGIIFIISLRDTTDKSWIITFSLKRLNAQPTNVFRAPRIISFYPLPTIAILSRWYLVTLKASIRDSSVRALDARDGDEFWFTTSSYTQSTTLYVADARKMSSTETTTEEDANLRS